MVHRCFGNGGEIEGVDGNRVVFAEQHAEERVVEQQAELRQRERRGVDQQAVERVLGQRVVVRREQLLEEAASLALVYHWSEKKRATGNAVENLRALQLQQLVFERRRELCVDHYDNAAVQWTHRIKRMRCAARRTLVELAELLAERLLDELALHLFQRTRVWVWNHAGVKRREREPTRRCLRCRESPDC